MNEAAESLQYFIKCSILLIPFPISRAMKKEREDGFSVGNIAQLVGRDEKVIRSS